MMLTINDLTREANFLLRRHYVIGLMLVALGLSGFSVWTGLSEVTQQNQAIERLLAADAKDRKEAQDKQSNYGGAAYYSFHLTYSPPSELAFAALGERDVYPWKHRIRMLALEGQIYENDVTNPELAQAGRIDFAFIISVLAPLFVILLLHDLRASERAAGRYYLLTVTAPHPHRIWLARTFVICAVLSVAFLVPFWLGALVSGVAFKQVLLTTLLVMGQIIFWAALCYAIGRLPATAPRLASALLGAWLVTTFIVPVAGDAAIEQAIESPKGGDILLLQREAVNDAWDLPYETTFEAFLAEHPQWQDHVSMKATFEWKWYYAFQQVGDQKALELSEAYRNASREKFELATWVSWLSPSMLVHRSMTRLANTDALAAFQYEQRIRDFHAELREFYYPLLFGEVPFEREKLEQLPQFQASASIKIKS